MQLKITTLCNVVTMAFEIYATVVMMQLKITTLCNVVTMAFVIYATAVMMQLKITTLRNLCTYSLTVSCLWPVRLPSWCSESLHNYKN
jgi:uncharacterized membrane protein